jgi:hypothetical protein
VIECTPSSAGIATLGVGELALWGNSSNNFRWRGDISRAAWVVWWGCTVVCEVGERTVMACAACTPFADGPRRMYRCG